jgi:hypothetical protein
MDIPNTFEEILKHIVYKCREEENPVADSLVAYLLNLQVDEGKIYII